MGAQSRWRGTSGESAIPIAFRTVVRIHRRWFHAAL